MKTKVYAVKVYTTPDFGYPDEAFGEVLNDKLYVSKGWAEEALQAHAANTGMPIVGPDDDLPEDARQWCQLVVMTVVE